MVSHPPYPRLTAPPPKTPANPPGRGASGHGNLATRSRFGANTRVGMTPIDPGPFNRQSRRFHACSGGTRAHRWEGMLIGHPATTGVPEIPGLLESKPELRTHPEQPSQASRDIRGHPALAVDQLVQFHGWDAELTCSLCLRKSQRLQELLWEVIDCLSRPAGDVRG